MSSALGVGGAAASPVKKSVVEGSEKPVVRELGQHLTGRYSASSDVAGVTPSVDQAGTSQSSGYEHRSAVAIPVAAIKSLLGVIRRSEANTMMELHVELQEATKDMMEYAKSSSSHMLLGGRSYIALASGCELFMKYVTRCFLELPDFAECKAQVLDRGERFAGITLAARDRIADAGKAFVQDGQVVLTHGWSRVVTALLLKAASSHRHFSIVLLEGRPDAGGVKAAKIFADAGIPCTVVLDSAMGHVMERVDLVIVGAEGVVENGGIVNKIGTYALAMAARELGKPFYVAAESYKFARMFPLNQSDLPDLGDTRLSFVDTASWEATGGIVGRPANSDDDTKGQDGDVNGVGGSKLICSSGGIEKIPGLVQLPSDGRVKVENPPCDYTPAKYITLLFTDLGVLTPSAVSDELIRLYQ